MPTQITKMVLK